MKANHYVSLTENIQIDNRRQIRRLVLMLAWPAIMEMFLSTLVQFVDTAMVGSLGQVAIAAVGISTTPIWVLVSLFAALGVGSTALVARFTGGKDPEAANRVAQQSLFVGVSLAILASLIFFIYAEYVPILMGAETEVIPMAASYLRIVSFAFIFAFSSFVLSGVLRGAGDTKTPMKINALSNVINVATNFLLIFPTRVVTIDIPWGEALAFTMPGAGMGVQGAAWATVLSRIFAGGAILFLLVQGKRGVKITLNNWRLDWSIIRRIFKIGLPAAGERLIISTGHLFFSIIVLRLGTVQYAAHHLAIIAESISYMPGFGFSMAATTLVGQGLGAGNPRLAEVYGYATWRLGMWVMGAMALIFFFFPEQLIMLFNQDPEIVAYGAMCLRLVAFAQLPLAGSMVLTGALRGAGDTVWPLIIAALGMWAVRLGAAWILVVHLEMGLMGAWLAMVLDLWIRGIITFLRFRSGLWKLTKV